MRQLYSLVVALGVLSSGACASAGAGPPQSPQEPDAATSVEVNNANSHDVVIYAVRGGMKFRLGTVTGLSSGTFEVPGSIGESSRLQLLADPIGSTRPYLTEPIPAAHGRTVVWRLGTRLQYSTYAIR